MHDHPQRTKLALIAAAVGLLMTGCMETNRQRLESVYTAYHQGDYSTAYRGAVELSLSGDPDVAEEATLMAGMSAYRNRNLAAAERELTRVARGRNPALIGDALASLGMIHAEQGRYDLAAHELLDAVAHLSDQGKANAYFYAAMAQRKIGKWPAASANLALAARHSRDPAFQQRVAQEQRVTGFTLQVGAFSDRANAQRAADAVARQAAALGLGQPRIVWATGDHRRRLALVQVGEFSHYAAAAAMSTQLGPTKAIVAPRLP